MKTLWQKDSNELPGREFFHQFTTGEDRLWDHHLIPYDILVNIAQARMLQRTGVYNDSELKSVTHTLSDLYDKWSNGIFTLSEEDEDVHSATEKYLTEQTGETGKRIHTGRSRNDQVVADINLALKDQIRELCGEVLTVLHQLDKIAKTHNGIYFAGMTHTQPAMPSSADSWASGYIRMLINDLNSILHAYDQVDFSPLGSAAGYGVPHIKMEREYIAEQLGFSKMMAEVTAAQPIRSASALKIAHSLEYIGLTYNRMAADIIEFLRSDIITLSDNQTSGSSIMPQKRNPDLWELIRGSFHRIAGAGRELSGIAANLTSGYHRDLQPVKAVIMQALRDIRDVTKAVQFGIDGLSFNKEGCQNTITQEVMATHFANEQVNAGVPFREAYRKTAQQLSEIKLPDHAALKATYSHTGAPGHYPEKNISDDIDEISSWLKTEQTKWDKVKSNLLGAVDGLALR